MEGEAMNPVHLFTSSRRIAIEVKRQLHDAHLRVDVYPMAVAPPATLPPGSCALVDLTPRDYAWRALIQQLVADDHEPVLGVMLTPAVRDAIDAIAMGAADVADLEHEAGELAQTVMRVAGRQPRNARSSREVRLDALTPRQRQVLALATAGLSSKQIAARLSLSKRTVDAHRRSMIQAADARCFIDLIREYVRHETLRHSVAPLDSRNAQWP